MSNKPKPANERRIRIGGLMRCCIETIRTTDIRTDIGEVLQCKFTDDPDDPGHRLIVADDGVWEWLR